MLSDRKERKMNESARIRLMEIVDEAGETAALYPGFELEKEFENPDFRRLMAAGVPVTAAYELIHRDELNGLIMEKAMRRARKAAAEELRAQSARPEENGALARAASETAFDPRRLTREERRNIKERVKRGESVTF